jgi:peptidoglycan/LPS O-acetylase OafA/YrhL
MVESTKSFFNRLFVPVTEIPEALQKNYFPSLDGFRALSVLTVIFFHSKLMVNGHFYYKIFNGPLAVEIFFIISGFLITTLLMKERVHTQSISLKKFYARRFLRIFPAAYIFLAVIIGISLVFKYKMEKLSLASCFLYLTNFYQAGHTYSNWATGHFWSLAVEEQFYFIFPFILKKDFRTYVLLVLYILLFVPVFIIVVEKFRILDPGPLYSITLFLGEFQGIALGSLAAILVFQKIIAIEQIKIHAFLLNLVNVVLILSIIKLGYNPSLSVANVMKNELISLLAVTLVMLNVFKPEHNLFYKLLNIRILKYIGVLSYSIYIWHVLFTDKQYQPLPAICYDSPYLYLGVFVIAFLSYNLIEKPFLRLKRKFASTGELKPPIHHASQHTTEPPPAALHAPHPGQPLKPNSAQH